MHQRSDCWWTGWPLRRPRHVIFRSWGCSPWHRPRCWSLAHHTGRRSRMPGRAVQGAQTRAPGTTCTFALGTDSRSALAAAVSSFGLGAGFAFARGTASGCTLAATSGSRLGATLTFAFDPVQSLRPRPSPCDSPLTSEDRWAFGTFRSDRQY